MKINSIDSNTKFRATLGEYNAIKAAGRKLAGDFANQKVGTFSIHTVQGDVFRVFALQKDATGMRIDAKLTTLNPSSEMSTHMDFDSFTQSCDWLKSEEGARGLSNMLDLMRDTFKEMRRG